ncbi:uncharacterized protein J7T54_001578 [Emericellopsis cladophorae]|uniref:Uncharacterized protein n=1 Tax=Emericellopsis cladophorae TaxID=2686198 RepID=A0A9P9Y556_9HYPO|nr:uncharacterized protein J7T54_001578 [Emericellopsis cladophorae]KAI6783702.1 hypothetical protein J7T54_001578 [Emericellopsis cladophorae]
MGTSNHNQSNIPHLILPKDSSYNIMSPEHVSPPPYNTRPPQVDFYTRPLTTTALEGDELDDSTISPLTLRINTSINILKNNNLICLSDSPANHATAIADAVTQAIQKHSSGNCGIPMIDGNGNPRPVRIDIDAGMVTDGVGNVVGSESIVLEVLRQRGDMKRQRESPAAPSRFVDESSKRRRSHS